MLLCAENTPLGAEYKDGRVTLDPSGAGSSAAVFGTSRHMPVNRLDDLPASPNLISASRG
jgi:hypothetical protein